MTLDGPEQRAERQVGQGDSSVDRPRVMSVHEIGLRLTAIRLRLLMCAPGDVASGRHRVADLVCKGALVADSLEDTGFLSEVTWQVSFPKSTPVRINGRHELRFAVSRAIDEYSARYYAEVNSVVFAYPYVRQLVSDLSVKSLGTNILIRPLDVPAFLREREKGQAKDSAIDLSAGAEADG